VRAVAAAGQVVTWVCDPMHANTEAVGRYKTRRYDNIRAEARGPALQPDARRAHAVPCLQPLRGVARAWMPWRGAAALGSPAYPT
jgi:hypothetical protein